MRSADTNVKHALFMHLAVEADTARMLGQEGFGEFGVAGFLHPGLASPVRLDVRLALFWATAVVIFLAALAGVVRVAMWMVQNERLHNTAAMFLRPAGGSADDLDADDSSDSGEEGLDMMKATSTSAGRRQSVSMHKSREKRLRRAFKVQWLRDSQETLLRESARCLCYLSSGLAAYQAYKVVRYWSCLPRPAYAVCLELVGLTLLAAGSFQCMRRPTPLRYYPLFLLFCFYLPAISLPPFAPSCHELVRTSCQSGYVIRAQRCLDCSLQGLSAQFTFMFGILLLPWLVPRQKILTRLAWVWVAVYILWTVAYVVLMGENILNIGDHIIRTLLFVVVLFMAFMKKFYLEKSQRNKFVFDLRRKQAGKKMFNILELMVPRHLVMPMLQDPKAVIAEHVNRASVMFVVISDFEHFAQKSSPQALLQFLNDIFTKFDHICKEQKVTKIETVAEEYVCCVGVVPADVETNAVKGHSELLFRLIMAAHEMLRLQSSTVKFKMGLHTGPVVAGVIGRKLPRFRLFGDTINTAARMMQKSVDGKLQFGQETLSDLQELPSASVESMRIQPRGKIEMKGKGQVTTFLFGGLDQSLKQESFYMEPSLSAVEAKRKSIFQRGIEAMAESNLDFGLRCFLAEPSLVQSNSRGLHETDGPEFDEVIQMIQRRQQMVATHGWSRMLVFVERFGLLSQKKGFTEEMEQEWYDMFHQQSFCKKLDQRLGRMLLFLLLLTLVEGAYLLKEMSWEQLSGGPGVGSGVTRLLVFVAVRAPPILVLLVWRFVVEPMGLHAAHPIAAQSAMLASSWVIAILIYVSYEVLRLPPEAKPSRSMDTAPFDQIYALNFFIAFYLLTGQQHFHFISSLSFVVLALLLMWWSFNGTALGPELPPLSKVFFVAISVTNAVLLHEAEQSSRARFKALCATESTKQRIESILCTLMPPMVVKQMQARAVTNLPSHSYEQATVAQSDLCGFTKLASTRTPEEVVDLVGYLVGCFDQLADKLEIYKVETVGDAYIAGQAEEPLTAKNSPANVVLFGIGMVDIVKDWASSTGVSVNCRVGIHHGPCIGGVVGTEMQRYHLFGSLLGGVEVLESTAPEGGVQVSQACKAAVTDQLTEEDVPLAAMSLNFSLRQGDSLTTSKGEVHSFDEVCGRPYLVSLGGMGIKKQPRHSVEP